MELFTRLIEEGVFTFWSDEENHDSYRLSFSINNMDKMINILTVDVEKNQHYYSLNNVGAGDYEISFSGIKDGKVTQTLTRKVKLSSNAQKSHEAMEKLNAINDNLNAINDNLDTMKDKLEELASDTNSGVQKIQNILMYPNDYKDVYSYADFEDAINRERNF